MPQLKSPTLCYLCGHPLTAPTSVDHVPPKQLYAKEIRKKHSPNLRTIKVHAGCNKSFQHDEDYFVNTLAPFARGSYAGTALLQEVFAKYAAGEKQKLVGKVLNEFQHAPGGILLPPSLVAKRFEGDRLHRVAWKIVRGLYFQEFGEVLPEITPNRLEIAPPDKPPPVEFLQTLHDRPSRGQYPGVFDYKYITVSQLNEFHYWGMLFWDRLILTMAFHNPACKCDHCTVLRSQHTTDFSAAANGHK
jgi:hypothetical protein